MEAWDLQLTVPNTHILLESYGEAYAPPIIGSVSIAVPSASHEFSTDGYPKINISLVRSVTPKTQNSIIPKSNRKSHGHLLKRLQKRCPTTSRNCSRAAPHLEPEVETVVQCNLWNSPDEVSDQEDGIKTWLRFNFCLPIPNYIPVTAETVLGNVSYAIAATVTSAGAFSRTKPLRVEQKTNILRCMVAEPLEYFRQYPGERVVTELCLTPKIQHPDSRIRAKAAYTAQWVARSTIKQGLRKTEVKYVVVKQLRWTVEETVQYITISKGGGEATTTCKKKHVRQLCDGVQKGHWIARGGIYEGEDWIEVPFDISIPAEVAPAERIDLSSYRCQHRGTSCQCDAGETTAITVDHQLRLEVITGEDTFDQGTRTLVDRKPRMKSFNAVFRLPIREFVSEDSITLCDDILPRYEDTYLMPPNYTSAVC